MNLKGYNILKLLLGLLKLTSSSLALSSCGESSRRAQYELNNLGTPSDSSGLCMWTYAAGVSDPYLRVECTEVPYLII